MANILTNIAAGTAGYAAGGGTGSNIASNIDANNRQLHPEEMSQIAMLAQDFAEKEGISYEEALLRLTQQTLKQINGYIEGSIAQDDDAAQFLMQNSGIFKANGQSYILFFAQSEEEKNNGAIFSQYLHLVSDLYNRLPSHLTSGGAGYVSLSSLAMFDATYNNMNYLVQEDSATVWSVYQNALALLEENEARYLAGSIDQGVYEENARKLDHAVINMKMIMSEKPELAHLVSMGEIASGIMTADSTTMMNAMHPFALNPDADVPDDFVEDYRYQVSTQNIEDGGCFVFAVAFGSQIRILGAKVSYLSGNITDGRQWKNCETFEVHEAHLAKSEVFNILKLVKSYDIT